MMFKGKLTRGGVLGVALAGTLLFAAVGAAAGTHTVKSGDTLYRIATEHGMTVEQLRTLNGLGKSSSLGVGQKLNVSAGKSASGSNISAERVAGDTAPGSKKKIVIRETLSPKSGQRTAKRKATVREPQLASTVGVRKKTGSAVEKASTFKGPVQLASSSAIVVDVETGQMLFSKNTGETKSIASITKLMTAMVALDANLPMQEVLTISDADVDYLKKTSSRLPVGTRLSRYEMLRLALMSSENRAASALARHYPGGRSAFINAMNDKAGKLHMGHTRFEDSTGLTPHNVSTAEDLVKMVQAASQYPLIHEFTTTPGREVALRPHSTPLQYKNSNVLVREASDWDIKVSKTGYTQEAGRCLVMMATVAHRPAVMVFLESEGKLSPVGDANRVKDWIESGKAGVTLAAR